TAWRELMADAPDSLACFAGIQRSPMTEEEGVVISVAYFGDPDEGYEAIQTLMDGPAPVADSVRPMYYAELQEIFGRMPFGLRNYWSGRFLRELSDDLIELTAEQFHQAAASGTILVEPLFGAAKRVAPDATAFAGREANFNATYINSWVDPGDDDRNVAVARGYSS